MVIFMMAVSIDWNTLFRLCLASYIFTGARERGDIARRRHLVFVIFSSVI